MRAKARSGRYHRLNGRSKPKSTSRIGESQALTIPLAKNPSVNDLLKTVILLGF
jgi:hypothetical protein